MKALGLNAVDHENFVGALMGEFQHTQAIVAVMNRINNLTARDIPYEAALDIVNLLPRRKSPNP